MTPPDEPPASAEKAALRREARQRLRSLPAGERAALGARIAERVWSVPEVGAAGALLLYASMPSEVPTDPIAEEARRRGIQVVYPRCPPETVAMTLHTVVAPELLAAGKMGFREPSPECPVAELATIDLAFIPGLAWDGTGARLGRGAGFYDRLLAGTPDRHPLRLGLFFAVQQLPSIPAEPWDAPLDIVVTEEGVLRFR